jgi:hypothetical protein
MNKPRKSSKKKNKKGKKGKRKRKKRRTEVKKEMICTQQHLNKSGKKIIPVFPQKNEIS